ncbi:hypothetical protein ACFE04_004131 [Oxalis oulophora]
MFSLLLASGKLSWDQVLRYARLRKKYISLYASLLKSDLGRPIVDDNVEIEELDRELDIELMLQWRMLAHKFVKQTTESEIYLKKQISKKSWWSFGWNKRPEFTAWLSEVKKINLESLPNWEEKQMFKE